MNAREVIPYTTEDAWLAERHKDITSTEASALFSANPWTSEFKLWHEKQQPEPSRFDANERMMLGNDLQDAVANAIAKRHGITIRPFKEYLRIAGKRMGSSFDYEIVGAVSPPQSQLASMFHQHGPGILEIKCVDLFAFKEGWLVDDEGIEAPERIEIQLQHQLHVGGHKWGAIGALIGGNRLEIIIRKAYPDIGESIEDRIQQFWQSIAAGEMPVPDYTNDADTIRAINSKLSDGTFRDLSGDALMAQDCARYSALGEQIKALTAERDGCMARIIMNMGDASKAETSNAKISSWLVSAGQVSYERKAFRSYRVTMKKGTV